MVFINYNGKVLEEGEVYISPDNRSFRYGDGFFETMKMVGDKIVLHEYHLERLLRSVELLQFEKPAFFSADNLVKQIVDLAQTNKHSVARIRCTFFRGDGGLYDPIDNKLNYIIQSWPLQNGPYMFNQNGLVLDVYKDAVKHADLFSSIKSNNFLPYVMGAMWAKKSRLNDCIILNPFDNIADATIANIFIVQNGTVTTPPLSDGPVDGVMRRYLIKCLKEEGIPTNETSVKPADLLQASEVFLTNAVKGLQWVKQVADSSYQNQLSTFMFKKFIEPLV